MKYIGMTIGPIFDTLSLATRPAGLWAGSFLFSDVAERLIKKLTDVIPAEAFVTPFVQCDENGGFLPFALDGAPLDGVGLYHDRIIFAGETEKGTVTLDAVRAIIDETKRELGELFARVLPIGDKDAVRDYIRRYLMIYAAEVEVAESENPILKLSPYLDGLELCRSYTASEGFSPFAALFEGSSQDKNAYLKALAGEMDVDLSSIHLQVGKGSIRDLESIAAGDGARDGKKWRHYIAVVRADGDNMGKTLQRIKQKDLAAFSKQCFCYGAVASKAIGDFGGVTVYAGGDDLLFLAPLKSGEKTVFDLVNTIEGLFDEQMAEYLSEGLSLSFGISVYYVKYPLYEVLADSAAMLFDVAKGTEGKNAVAFHLCKHSGQSASIILPQFRREQLGGKSSLMLLNELIKMNASEDFLRSIAHKLGDFRLMFKNALARGEKEQETVLQNLFDNLFDSGVHDQKEVREKLEAVKAALLLITPQMSVNYGDDKPDPAEGRLDALENALRIAKFFVEEGGEEE